MSESNKLLYNKYTPERLEELCTAATKLYSANTFEELQQLFVKLRHNDTWYTIDDGILYKYGNNSALREVVSGLDNFLNTGLGNKAQQLGYKYAKEGFEKHLRARALEEITVVGSKEAGVNLDV